MTSPSRCESCGRPCPHCAPALSDSYEEARQKQQALNDFMESQRKVNAQIAKDRALQSADWARAEEEARRWRRES